MRVAESYVKVFGEMIFVRPGIDRARVWFRRTRETGLVSFLYTLCSVGTGIPSHIS